jgi:galactokinase
MLGRISDYGYVSLPSRDLVNAVTASAPARVNIIGEHTDYNAGLVLPTCTALLTKVRATPRADREVHVQSSTIQESAEFNLDSISPDKSGAWIEYVKGVAAGLQDAGIELRGANLEIDSKIPLGAGLSSSASLELSVANALLGVSGEHFDAVELALLCQKAEQEYAGVQCGIMDQYALACAQYGNALLVDCRSLQTQQVALPEDIAFILTDSGIRHSLVDGEYNNRAEECAAAVAAIAKTAPSVSSLRDVTEAMLQANKNELDDALFRRCRHVIAENQRVQNMVQALQTKDLPAVGELLNDCHKSLRDDYAVSCAELDALVECANSSRLVLGSRMVGAGFGGCVLSACQIDNASDAATDILKAYAEISGGSPWQHLVKPAHPAGLEENV